MSAQEDEGAPPYFAQERRRHLARLVRSRPGGCMNTLAYGVANGVLPQFTRSLARELADTRIRVNCVVPGIICTRFQDYRTPEQ